MYIRELKSVKIEEADTVYPWLGSALFRIVGAYII